MQYWATFAKTGTPGAPGGLGIEWPRMGNGTTYLTFDGPGGHRPTVAATTDDAHTKAACAFWDAFLVDKITTGCPAPGPHWAPAC